MSQSEENQPTLEWLYQSYLNSEDSAGFIKAVANFYTIPTLERLATRGPRSSRRAAVLGLSFLSDMRSNAVIGECLHDDDRGVRILADNAIRQLWSRDGAICHQHTLMAIVRLNGAEQYDEAIELASSTINEVPWFAEVWNQRAIALFHNGEFELSANDCQQALDLNPVHFGAAVGMAHCYLEMGDAFAALGSFRRAVAIHPDMDAVKRQIDFLQRTLEGK